MSILDHGDDVRDFPWAPPEWMRIQMENRKRWMAKPRLKYSWKINGWLPFMNKGADNHNKAHEYSAAYWKERHTSPL